MMNSTVRLVPLSSPIKHGVLTEVSTEEERQRAIELKAKSDRD